MRAQVVIVAGVAAAIVGAAALLLALDPSRGTYDFIVVNETGGPLTDVRLYREHESPTGELGRMATLAPGEAVRVPHTLRPSFRLCVEYTAPDGRFVAHEVIYIDPDEPGDDQIPITSDHRVLRTAAAPIR